MKLLFVCKHNRFRSKVAEVIFNKLKRKEDECKSCGIVIDFLRQCVAENVKLALKEKGYNIEAEKARQLNDYDLRWADKIIIVADNVSPDLFPGEKTIVWKIKDADEKEAEKIKEIVEKIETKVKGLILTLNE
jgi:protein-tyrosine-phosphatase